MRIKGIWERIDGFFLVQLELKWSPLFKLVVQSWSHFLKVWDWFWKTFLNLQTIVRYIHENLNHPCGLYRI